jgi:outer membrane protein assembly factor BamD (BamD/ComL family)
MMAARQFDAAIPVLDDLVTKYKMLMWDNEARKLLAMAYMGKNDAKKAAATLDEYFTMVPKAQVPADVQLIYWNALLAADRASTLKKDLDEVIATGPREMAAAAQIMRGNMNRQAGQKEAATLDYLRVVVLYENVKSVQPEALFKAAEMLEELRDARAETLRKKLVQEYKDSEWAAKLSGKI